MASGIIEIIGGDHDPPHPFMVIDGFGVHVDLARVTAGTLWDAATVDKIIWGLRTVEGRRYGPSTARSVSRKPRHHDDQDLRLGLNDPCARHRRNRQR